MEYVMAHVQMPTVVRPVRSARAPAIVLAAVSVLLLVAIALAVFGSGVLTRSPIVNAGDIGTSEWITYRAGVRAPFNAPAAQADVGRRAAAEGQMSSAGIHGSLAGTSGSAVGATSSGADPLLSGATVDLRRCERDSC
jgi:hypothetical protein